MDGLPSDWPSGNANFANLSMDLITPSSSLSSMVDSYVASVWENPTNSHPLSGILSPTAATEFAYFNPGNVADLMHSFAMNQPVSPYSNNQLIAPMPVLKDTGPMSDESDSGHNNGCQEDVVGAKKRKRGGKEAELELPQQLSGRDDTDDSKQNSPLKQCSEASDPPKEEYVHVRARRGQATNSHSLAERVRREKIRERMKLLQDLVPSCSKVTGKAVMLDEIINYVQSLQRQVEFLSMKLATVDPRKDFNIVGLLAKDQMFGRRAAPSSLGLSPDMPMAYHLMNPSQPSVPVIGSSSDVLRNLDYDLPSLHEGCKEHTQQMPNVWNDELQNVVQMGFSPSAALDNQETPKNNPLPAGHMKVEL